MREKLSTADAAVLTEYRGLNVPQMAALRESLRESGGELKVYKNTLVRFAARDLGIEIEDLLVGPTAIVFAARTADKPGDAVGIAKVLRKYANDHEAFVIKGGVLSGRRLTADDVKALADVAPVSSCSRSWPASWPLRPSSSSTCSTPSRVTSSTPSTR